jgi:formylglycine-generating enzyme required for sulfatase activity
MDEFEFEVVTVNARGEIIERKVQRARQFSQDLGGGVKLEMVSIPGGLFSIGSPGHTGYEDEHPQHPVTVAPFFLGKFLITQEQWRAVTGKQPTCRCTGDKNPVDRVSWPDGQSFCKRLTKKTGRAYRLPSEAEWEYACRARTGTPFYFGATLTDQLANYVAEHVFADEPKGMYRHVSTPGGTFPPNEFGLYDMHGNLWEWCADTWHESYTGAPSSAAPWEERGAEFRVVRGGSWHEIPNHCRSAVRLKFKADERDDVVGLRVALSA